MSPPVKNNQSCTYLYECILVLSEGMGFEIIYWRDFSVRFKEVPTMKKAIGPWTRHVSHNDYTFVLHLISAFIFKEPFLFCTDRIKMR